MKSKEKTFVSAVIYVRNCEKTIEIFLSSVIKVMEENFEHSEIICVNDDSNDASVGVIKKVASNTTNASVTVVNMSYFHGLEVAMTAGMDLAIGDFVFEFDNTIMDYEEEFIMKVYRHSLEGFDIVSASPNRGESFSSRLFYRVFDRFSNLDYEMTTESFRILSRRVINRIGSMNKTVPYRKVVYAGSGLKTDNLKYDTKKTIKTTYDKEARSYRMELATDSLILFTEMGYRLTKLMTAVMMIFSIIMIAYTVAVYTFGHPIEGWTTTVLFLSIAFFGLFSIMTIVVKYLQLIINMVFKRKHYSFESIEKLTK